MPARDEPTTLEERFAAVQVWRRGDERAPHKPLLLLYALGRLSRGEMGPIPYADVARDVGELLREFGPARSSVHPEYPFWRLQRDGLWVVETPNSRADALTRRVGQTDVPSRVLLDAGAVGAFPPAVQDALARDPVRLTALAHQLLDAHFPSSLHDDIRAAVGLEFTAAARMLPERRTRDAAFRDAVLTAYEYRCGVCAFDVRIGQRSIGLDAAHIMWFQAGGPDETRNGVALCVLHHKLFDRGAFTLFDDGRIVLSERVTGGEGFQDVLLRHHGTRIRAPQRPDAAPASTFLAWHRREVFQGRPRHLG